MPIIVKKFQLDRTGLNPDNLIEDEIHTTIDIATGILIPEFKNFFTESMVVVNHLDEVLVRDTDWVPIEFNSEASLMVGKEICTAIILLTNLDGNPIKISYQLLGGVDTFSSSNLIAAYVEKVPPNSPIAYEDIFDKPTEFSPVAHHLHDADEMYGMEYVVDQLDRITQAIQSGSYPTLIELIAFIDTALIKIQSDTNNYLTQNMQSRLDEFVALFNREFIGVDQIQNLGSSEEKDGYDISKRSFDRASIVTDKYALIETLIGFKRGLFENLIRKDLTGLDLTTSKYGIPSAHAIKDIGNGSLYTSVSKNVSIINEIVYSDNFFPANASSLSEMSIFKLSNSLDSNDSDVIVVDRDTLNTYWGVVIEELVSIDLNWKQLATYERVDAIEATLDAHIDDNLNPHQLTKLQIELEKVENLAVVTVEDVEKVKSVRKYITFDTLLLYARKHFLQNGPASPADPEYRNSFIIDNAVVVYSPAGKSDVQIVNPVVTGLDGTFMVNTSIGYSISGGEPNSVFSMRSGLVGVTPTTKTLTLNSVGGYIGYLALGNTAGVVQTFFTFKGNKTSAHNSVVIAPADVVIPDPEPVPAPIIITPPVPAPIIVTPPPPPPPVAPPPVVYSPQLQIATNKTTIGVGASETITITVAGGQPSSTLTVLLTFKYLSGSYKNITASVAINLNASGGGTGTVAAGNPRAVCPVVSTKFMTVISGVAAVWPTATGGLPGGKWSVVGSAGSAVSNTLTRTLNTTCTPTGIASTN